MKRFLSLMLALAFLISFAACDQTAMTDPQAPPVSAGDSTPAPTQDLPYDGDGSHYEYRYTMPRFNDIERDIIQIADVFLDEWHGYNKFVDSNVIHEIQDNGSFFNTDEYSEYDDELRTEFIRRINHILTNIPNMQKYEIRYELLSALALLNDIHSNLYFDMSYNTFPVWVVNLEHSGRSGYFVTQIDWDHPELIKAELKAINGHSLDEIIELARPIIPHENDYGLETVLFTADRYAFSANFLNYIEILDDGETTAMFTFKLENGETADVELTACDDDSSSLYRHTTIDENIYYSPLSVIQKYRQEKDQFYEYIEDYNTLYIRFNSCSLYNETTDEFFDIDEFTKGFTALVEEVGGIDKLIVDFRSNSGGNYTDDMRRELFIAIRDLEAVGGKYLLIDQSSFSAAVLWPAAIKRHFGNKPELGEIIIAGCPAAEPPACYSILTEDTRLESLDCFYTFGQRYISTWADYPYDALMPDEDWYIKQTYDDFYIGYDTVLKTICEE